MEIAGVHEDIQYRIRSLLEPRNKRRPPEALYSSPDLKHYPRHGDQVLAADQLIPSRSHILDAGQIVLFPARLNFLPSTMVVTRFNRSAFEVADGFKGPLRKVSQPDMRAGRAYAVDGPWSSVESGLSQRAIVDSPDGEMSVSGGVKHADFMSSKSPSKSRPPHYDLRVLPPKRSRVRPDVLHVPGSYKSEITPDGYGSPELGGQHAEDDHRGHNHGNLDLNDHLGTIVEPSTSALAALDELKKYEVRPLEVSKRVVDEQGCGNGGGSVYMEVAPLISRSSSLHAVQSDAQERTDTNSTALLTGVPTPVAQKEVDVSAPLSPVSRALSALSDLSSRSKSRRESSVSITPNQRRGSAIKPSEIRQIGKSPSTVSTSHSVNRENEQQSQWVQQLVGKRPAASPSSSNLTARLQRQNTQSVVGPGGLRTWTMPDPNDNKTASRKVGTEDTDEADFAQRQQNNSQSFSKVIVDLENLLKEALTIAGKTASRDASEAEQNDVMEKPRKQSNKRYNQVRSTETSCNSKTESSISGGADEEDMHITSGMGGRVTIVDPDPDASYHGHFIEYRDATPYPAQSTAITRQQSTVRPIGQCSSDDKEVTTKSRDIGMPLGKPINENAPAETSHHLQPFKSTDWAYSRKASANLLTGPQKPPSIQMPLKEESRLLAHNEGMSGQQRPPIIQPRSSSKKLQGRRAPKQEELNLPDHIASSGGSESDGLPYVADYKTSALQCHPIIQEVMDGDAKRAAGTGPYPFRPRQDTIASLRAKETLTYSSPRRLQNAEQEDYSLKDRHHFSIREPKGFSLSRSHRRKPIARDWSTGRKRLVATVDCITTALMGLILGIYAGEVPALQYALADEHHYTILGNVVFFLGLAITTILLWPLPLLHGRKPYTMAALVILLPLQFPQALAVNSPRSPYVPSYKVGVLLPRAFSGLVMGFANINFMTTLLDLFGASLQSGNPHQESVNENDVRRHGGGIGAWLGIWTWCSIMSIGLGFLIGAGIISGLGVSWGFWITIILNAVVLLLNVMAPEVRRSPYRRSMAEVRSGTDVSRRVARGEVKMHLESTGPKHWYEEVLAGYVLCLRMLRQPGFLVLALYQGWIYGQIVMVIVLLGALLSKYYSFHPQYVGLGVAIVPLAALLAVPFQKASVFSRARHHKQRTDSMTFEKRVTWTSHLVRRSVFMIVLPFAGLAYTLASNGSVHFMAPIIFAGLIGFLSNLAIAECNGLIMETFDTSDLQPGMTGRPRRVLPEEVRKKRTNFSCFPRVTAGFAIAQTFAFLIAAGATGWGGVIERHLGAQTATAVVAGILLILTLLLIAVLWRFKTIQVIPSERFGTNILSGPEDEWKPIIIGNPSGTTRRMNILELGRLSRWSEIRKRNRLGSI